MAEQIRGFTIELSLDSLKVDSGLKDVKKSLRNVNSEMRNNMSAFSRGDRSIEKYQTQLGGLNKKLEVQKHATEEARKSYDRMVELHGEGSRQAMEAASAYNNEAAKLNNLERYIGSVTDEMREFAREQQIQESGWYKTGDALQNFGSRLGGISQMAMDVGGALTKYITLPAVGVAAAAGGIVASFGWDRLVGLDTAKAQLTGLGYSTKEVGSITDTVTRAIDGGMTTMAEGTSIAAGALAAGVKEGAELEKYIKLVGDAAAGSGAPVDEMAQIFHRVQGNGKLTRRELDQINYRLPGFSQAMAEHVGAGSLEAFHDMVTAGKVSSEDFLEVMDDFAGGMAAAYADSWQGMVQNTKAYIGIIGENLLSGVFEESKDSLREFEDLMRSPAVKQWAEETGEKLAEAFVKVVEGIKGVVNWYRNLSEGQQKLVLGLGGFLVALGPVLLTLGKLGNVISATATGLGTFFKWLAPILTPLKGVAASASSAGGSVGFLGRALSILGGPVGWIIGIVTTLGTAFTVAYKKSDSFREGVHNLIEKLKEMAVAILDWMKPGFDAVLSFFGEIKMRIGEFSSEEGPQLIEAFQNIWNFVGPILTWLGEKVKWVFQTIIKPIMTGVMWAVEEVIKSTWGHIKGLIENSLDVIMGSVRMFSGLFTGDWSKMWEGIKQLTIGAVKAAWDLINLYFIGRILKGVGLLVRSFGGLIKGMWTTVKNAFTTSINFVWAKVKGSFIGRTTAGIINFAKNFRTHISNLWTKIKGLFTRGISFVWTKTKESFIGRIIKGIINFAKNFRTHISNLWTKVKGLFTRGISFVWTKTKESFIGRIIRGIIDFAKKFRTRISNMWSSIKNNFASMISNIYNRMKESFIGRIIRSIIDFAKNFRTRISNMWDSIKRKFTTMIKSIYNSIKNSFVGNIIKSVTGMKNRFIGVAKSMWGGVKKQFNNIVDGAKKLPGRIGNGIAKAKKGATDGMKKMGNGLLTWAAKPFNKVGSGINWVTEKLGMGKVIQGKWSPKKYAHGTGSHPGGPAVLGDGKGSNSGSELVNTPGGSFLSASKPTLYPNLPKGSQVLPAKQTRQVPMYAKGIFGSTKDFVAKMWGGAKKAGSWLSEKIGDVWDWVKKPGKLMDKVMSGVGYPSKDSIGEYPFQLIKSGYKAIKKQAAKAVKGWFTEAEEGGGGGKPNFKYGMTSPFGPRQGSSIVSSIHKGVDFGFPHGAKVPSQTGGNVKFAGYGKSGSGYGGYGNVVSVKNGIMEVLYAHLSKVMKKVGDTVSQGDILGLSGNTGNSTGPHLHYEVRKNGKAVDPMKLSSGGAPGGTGVGRWRSEIKRAAKQMGVSVSGKEINGILSQIKRESNGNDKITQSSSVNDINMRRGTPAQGLLQYVPSTFNSYKVPGYGNIKNGYHQLLAFFNNKNWRKDLPYGTRGWGPTGGTKYKQGTNFVPNDQFAFLHKGEAVIPRQHNPAAGGGTEAQKLIALAGKKAQSRRSRKREQEARNYERDILNATLEQNRILLQLLQKDTDVHLDGEKITDSVNTKNAIAAIGKHF